MGDRLTHAEDTKWKFHKRMQEVVDTLRRHTVDLSRHRYGSVVVREIMEADDKNTLKYSKLVIAELVKECPDGSTLVAHAKHEYVNLVLERALQTIRDALEMGVEVEAEKAIVWQLTDREDVLRDLVRSEFGSFVVKKLVEEKELADLIQNPQINDLPTYLKQQNLGESKFVNRVMAACAAAGKHDV